MMPAKDIISTIKDAAVALREVALIALLAVLLFNPPVLVGWLENSKLEKVGVFGISFEARKAAQESRNQGLAAANEVSQLKEQARITEANFGKLQAALEKTVARTAGNTSNASARSGLDDGVREISRQLDVVRRDIEMTRAAAQRAQTGTQKALIAQTQAVEKAGGSVKREGWVWVGQIDTRTGKLRDVGTPETVYEPGSLDPGKLTGSLLRFRSTTDIYQEPFDGAGRASPIVAVAAAETAGTVLEAKLIRFKREGLPLRDADDQILWARIAPRG